MSGGGGKHRAPIEMPPDDGKTPGFGRQVERDPKKLKPADGDSSAYRASMRSAVVHHVVTAFLIAMVLGIGTWGYLTFKNASIEETGSAALKQPLFEVPAGDAQLDRFRFALEVYFRIYEKYPPDLDALVDEGLLAGSDLSYPRGSSTILYERLGDSYQLTIERTRTTVTDAIVTDGADGGDAAGEPDAGAQTNGAGLDGDEE